MPKKTRTYNPNRAKARHSYSLKEIAGLFRIHLRTVQSWRKQGLKVLNDDSRPFLVLGEEIRNFLKKKALGRKFPLQNGEFFCPRCRKARRSLKNQIVIEITNKSLGKWKHVIFRGSCEVCHIPLRRFSSTRQLEELKASDMLILERDKLLPGSGNTIINAYMRKDGKDESEQ